MSPQLKKSLVPVSAGHVDDPFAAFRLEEVDQEVLVVDGALRLVADVQLPDLGSLAVGVLVHDT